jgi:hypothetical protein
MRGDGQQESKRNIGDVLHEIETQSNTWQHQVTGNNGEQRKRITWLHQKASQTHRNLIQIINIKLPRIAGDMPVIAAAKSAKKCYLDGSHACTLFAAYAHK